MPPETKSIGTLIEEKTVKSRRETADFAKKFAARIKAGDVVAFYGELGSGKTFIIKEIARYFQTEEEATSPTFTIINVYHTGNDWDIYHFDFYRLEHDAELSNIGLDDYFYRDDICLIEWADKIQKYLPLDRYDVFIEFVEGETERRRIEVYQVAE